MTKLQVENDLLVHTVFSFMIMSPETDKAYITLSSIFKVQFNSI